MSYLKYRGILAAIPKDWMVMLQNNDFQDVGVSNYDLLSMCENMASKVYEQITSNSTVFEIKRKKWESELNVSVPYEIYLQCILDIHKVMNITKYHSFHYRLLLRALVTNIHLKHWGMLESDLCTFCKKVRETVTHLFVQCEVVCEIWLRIEPWLVEFLKEKINFGINTVISNRLVDNPAHVINFIGLVFKQYVYQK